MLIEAGVDIYAVSRVLGHADARITQEVYAPLCGRFMAEQAGCEVSSGANRDRTGDLLNAIQALSQLSYSPGPFDGHPWEGDRTGAGS